MFRKMLIATDLTPSSNALIQCAEALKGIGTQEVVLTHVVGAVDAPGLEEVLPIDDSPLLKRQKDLLEQQGLKVTVETPFGVPAQALEETAQRHEVSAILIGSHGKGVIRSAALGSVSAEVLKRIKRPLLLDRFDVTEEGVDALFGRKLFSRVLFPTDFSETAERAMDYLGKIALETGCRIMLLHVIETKSEDAEINLRREEDSWYLLEAKKRRLERLGADEVSIDLVHGRPAQEIVSRTRKGAFSVVVMGGQGKGLLSELFLGSTANEVARHAELPVLFVPAEAGLEASRS